MGIVPAAADQPLLIPGKERPAAQRVLAVPGANCTMNRAAARRDRVTPFTAYYVYMSAPPKKALRAQG